MTLVRRIYRAMNWAAEVEAGLSFKAIAERENLSREFVRNNIKFAFLSPRIVEQIMAGQQPLTLTTERLRNFNVPISWTEQDKVLR